MNIRLANSDDILILFDLNTPVQKIHAEKYPHIFQAEPSFELFAKDFRDYMAENQILIAEISGEPVGYCMVRLDQRKNSWIHRDHSILYVDQISVNQEVQGKGIGRELMKRAEQFGKDHGAVRIELDYWNENSEAAEFYARLGFVPYCTQVWKEIGDNE